MSKTVAIYSKEDGRRHLVQNILLQDEKDLLHTQLVESERLVDELERGQIYNQNQLAIAQKSIDKAQQDLRVKSRDNDVLKVCAFFGMLRIWKLMRFRRNWRLCKVFLANPPSF